ncbi:MAG: methyltransferase [Ancrocorticia sp.]
MPHSPFTLPDPRDLVPVDFPYDRLDRWPDPTADNLFAFDATDRLLVDMAAPAIREAASGSVVVMGDRYGALTLAAVSLGCPGSQGIRCHQDAYGGRMALQANFDSLAGQLGLAGPNKPVPDRMGADTSEQESYAASWVSGGQRVVPKQEAPGSDAQKWDVFQSCELDESLLVGAEVVLMQLPKDLSQLEHWASLIATYASASVKVFAGGRIKHMTRAMNEVLERHFGQVSASLARQKSRVLVAGEPRRAAVTGIETRDGSNCGGGKREGLKRAPGQSLNQSREQGRNQSLSGLPEGEHHESSSCSRSDLLDSDLSEYFDPELKLWVCSYPGAFAAGRVDIGTRFLIPFIEQMPRFDGGPAGGGINSQRLQTTSRSRLGRGSQLDWEGRLGESIPLGATGTAADLGCGTGLLTAALLRSHPEYHVIATDRSAVAVRSAKATLRRNGFEPLPDGSAEHAKRTEETPRRDESVPAREKVGSVANGSRTVRYEVRQDHALFQQPDASLDLIVCNPPFHSEASVSTALSEFLFREAARTLRPGGIMLTVFNSHLQHRRALQRLVGPTEQLGRNQKFTVTRTVRF